MKFKTVRRTATAVIIIGIAAFGIHQKQSYTNLFSKPDALNSFQVAEFPEAMIPTISGQLLEELPKSSIIIRGIATGEKDYLFRVNQQTVSIQQVYQGGDDIQPGEEIHVASRTGFVFRDNPNGRLAELGFVNEMRAGMEYLIFLEKKIDTLKTDDQRDVYRLAEALITPIFGYEDRENVIVDVSQNYSTYVDYSSVSGNEFFMTTQTGLNEIINIKRQLLIKYPRQI